MDLSAAWRGSFAAAYYHSVTRDCVYFDDAEAIKYFRGRLAREPQASAYKRYPDRPFVRLKTAGAPLKSSPIGDVLLRRRTVRDFRRLPVSKETFAAVVKGTWAQTGWIDGGIFGKLVGKTSPSAGARHPIECYALVWRVEGLRPGLYHYNVRKDGLERLRTGDFRREAVRFASGQRWIARAAFLCVLTAVADRVFWKYPSSDAYRLFFLDAGHLAQTFCLLATSHGLGPFTTAALQESRIQKFLGLDGTREFPVYLCGAGAALLEIRASASKPGSS